ncbi:hypothetical protein MED121_02170 [Marinomonas sp. MED121]|uniref:gp436 family protein n=1 Tax=Marinomonas sp. MED121 TaxID=314277 RepID=UPI0000690B39|nr:DUF1320 domain-containing protein [Marinomonas sp. MED121]EAQ65979.1 hypothetical protein MED121_02170 [Marinomonas sp. MED121]
MATYATKQDLLDRGESMVWNLAIDRSTEVLSDTAIDEALSQADDEINSYLARRYVLPLPEVPSLLRKQAVTIAFYWLADRDQQATNLMMERYEKALASLKEIAKGSRELGLPTLSAPTEGAVGKVELVQDNERLFTRKGLGGVL